MPRKKSTTLYRPFLRDAWRITWERKGLWIFGIFAALISTGGVMDVVWRSLERIKDTETLLENLMNASFFGYDLAASFIGQMAVLGPDRMNYLIIATTLMGVLLVIIATLSQGALLRGVGSKTHVDAYTLRQEAATHFWSLFVVAALNKILMGLLLMLMTLPLWMISVSTITTHAITFFLLMILLIPAVIIVNIIYMFAIIDIVEADAHPLDAIKTGYQLFVRQWLACFEYGMLIFFVVFGAGMGLLILLSLLLTPLSALFSASLLTGSYSLFLTTTVLIVLTVFAIILLFGGTAVTFQYSAWYQFYKRGLHKTHGRKLFSKLMRLLGR